jgi:hypothetical protein
MRPKKAQLRRIAGASLARRMLDGEFKFFRTVSVLSNGRAHQPKRCGLRKVSTRL